MHVCMDGWMGGWMGGWMDGWVDVWMDGWIDGCVYIYMHVCMYVCMHTHANASLKPIDTLTARIILESWDDRSWPQGSRRGGPLSA